MPSPQPREQPIPSGPDGVPAGTPTKLGDLNVYGRSEEEVRLGLEPLPRVTLTPEFVQRHRSILFQKTQRWATWTLKDCNLLMVVFYVWPLLEQMIFQTNWRIYAKPYDQDHHDAISISFMVGKDRAYRRMIWVMVGVDCEELEGTKSAEDLLQNRLARQAVRYGCIVDPKFLTWTFYRYDDHTYTLQKEKEFKHTDSRSREGQPQEIVDFMVKLLHRDDTNLPFGTWDQLHIQEQTRCECRQAERQSGRQTEIEREVRYTGCMSECDLLCVWLAGRVL